MFTHIDFDTASAERAERVRDARRRQVVRELRRADRLHRWADRASRFSRWLAGLARRSQARVG